MLSEDVSKAGRQTTPNAFLIPLSRGRRTRMPTIRIGMPDLAAAYAHVLAKNHGFVGTAP